MLIYIFFSLVIAIFDNAKRHQMGETKNIFTFVGAMILWPAALFLVIKTKGTGVLD